MFCVLDSGCRSRRYPCRNSMSPSLEPSLEHGPAAATLVAAFLRRRLRFAFSRFRLRRALVGFVALPLAGSAFFPVLLSFVCVLAATLAACCAALALADFSGSATLSGRARLGSEGTCRCMSLILSDVISLEHAG